jgi:hypothetical protein
VICTHSLKLQVFVWLVGIAGSAATQLDELAQRMLLLITPNTSSPDWLAKRHLMWSTHNTLLLLGTAFVVL